jgi:hypothetical protein
MTDISTQVQTLQKQIDLLTAEVRSLRSFEYLPKQAIVGADYVSMLYGCSSDAVTRGRHGTGELRNKRVRFNPDGWLKADVDAAHKDFIKTAPERAMEAERAASTRSKRRRKT